MNIDINSVMIGFAAGAVFTGVIVFFSHKIKGKIVNIEIENILKRTEETLLNANKSSEISCGNRDCPFANG